MQYFGGLRRSPGGAKYAAEPSPILSGGVNKEHRASTQLTPGQRYCSYFHIQPRALFGIMVRSDLTKPVREHYSAFLSVHWTVIYFTC